MFAWIIAVALAATETSLTVAVVFVPAGWALIGAASFYRRLRKFGPRGVEVDPAEAIQIYSQIIPPAAADASAPGERARLLDGLSAYLEQMADPKDIRNAAESAADRYMAGVALEVGAKRWLREEGFEVEVLSGPLDKGVDLIGRREDVIYVAIVKSSLRGAGGPTPEQLRPGFLLAREAAIEGGEEGPFFRFLVTDVVPPPHLRDRYRIHGVGIVHVDPDSGAINQIVKARDSRQ
ncbi:MAG: hypothetical protein ACTHNY_02675 [Solirubrobacterales bacterium]